MKLVKGAGSEKGGACWMSALHYYTREDRSWSDAAPWACVSPVIRALCIRLNDMCDDGERESLIGPHLFEPLGTATGIEDERRRAFMVADTAIHAFAPIRMRATGRPDLAERMEGIPAVVDRNSAIVARDAAYKIRAAAAAAAAYDAAYDAAAAAYAAAAYDDAAAAAAYAAACDAAYDAAARKQIKPLLLDLILRCCAVGERKEVAEACSRERVLEMLECGS